MQNQQPMTTPQYDDEIDLFELFQTLWQQKWLIISISLIAPIIAYVFTAVMPYKADYYQGSAVIEVATIQAQSERGNPTIHVIESTGDVVQLISKLTLVSASIPKGATKLLEISVSGSTPEQVTNQLDAAVKIVEQRHIDMVSKLKHIEVVSMTRQVGDYAIDSISPKAQRMSKLNLILAVAFVLGGMLGVFIALIRSAIRKRKLQAA